MACCEGPCLSRAPKSAQGQGQKEKKKVEGRWGGGASHWVVGSTPLGSAPNVCVCGPYCVGPGLCGSPTVASPSSRALSPLQKV